MIAWDWVVDNKEALTAGAAVVGALVGALIKNGAQKKDATPLGIEQAALGPRPMVVRLHGDDRAAMGELKDAICDLGRSVKRHGDIVYDHADALNRRPRRN